MKKIKLAIVGRPNVGKSALFNRICGRRIAIVDEEEGTTRDRLYGETDFFGRTLEIVDTGGIDTRSGIAFGELIRRQAEIAIEEADAIIMVVDGLAGVMPLDLQVAQILLRQKKPLTLAVNKVDDLSKVNAVHQFHNLAIPRMIPISASQGYQIAELLETALSDFPREVQEEEVPFKGIRVAIVGRPNVGKSTLLNQVVKEDRSVVSPIPGTTRDAIDVEVPFNDTVIRFVDTAGIRRKSAEHEAVDKFAAVRTADAIDKADLCLLVLDAQEGLTAHDKRIASMIEEKGKGCILLLNKWDLIKGHRMEHCDLFLRDEAAFLNHCPRLFISAQNGKNLSKIFPLIEQVYQEQNKRVTTGQLNTFLEKAIQAYHPPMIQGKRLRIYYMAQVETAPPTFVLFVNYPNLMLETYKRYLVHQFRKTYQFAGNPLVFSLKARKRRISPHDVIS